MVWVDRVTTIAFFEALVGVFLIILGASDRAIFLLGGLLLCTWGIVLLTIVLEERAKQ